MAVIGTVDVAVHLHRVHNIDLFCRGVYYLRTSLLLCSKNKPTDSATSDTRGAVSGENAREHQVEAHGIPYMCLAQCEDMGTTVSHRKVPPLKEPRLQGPAVHGHHYHTRMFVIRYRDEELELGEVVNFQVPVQLDAGRRWLEAGQTLVLQMELMFSKLASLERENSASKRHSSGSRVVEGNAGEGTGDANGELEEKEEELEEEDILNLEPVAVQRFEASLSGGHWGLHAYVPITFSGVHFVRVDCMVHGVLRNLKLEAPRPSQEEARLTSASAAAAAAPTEEILDSDTSAVSDNAARVSPPASALGGDDDLREGLPASLGRLGEGRGDNGMNTGLLAMSSGAAAKKVSPPPQTAKPSPKYTWFSLYDEQGVGRRRISPSHIHVPGDAETEQSTSGDGGVARRGGSDPEYGARTPKQRSSKAGGSWRWGWGRREHSPRAPAATTPENRAKVETVATEVAATAAAEAGAAKGREEESSGAAITPQGGGGDIAAASCGGGGQEGDGPDITGNGESAKREEDGEWGEAPQVLEVLTTRHVSPSGESRASGAAAAERAAATGKKLAESLEHEGRRLKRKDVYSYFMMPLIRALEAQMGTTSWLRKLLEGEGSKEIPTSAVSLWLPPDPESKQDVMRVLRRLFASPDDIADGRESEQDRSSAPLSEGGGAACNGASGTSERKEPRGKGVPRISGAPHGYPMPSAAARVAFPSLIARYGGEVKRKNDDAERAADWLDSDETVCTALEVDVHALAMLVFVEWREFVSAIPGCGAVLSRETSALWFAQIRQRWACQATLHTCSALQRPPPSLIAGGAGTQPPSPAFDSVGCPSKVPASALGTPLLSRLEPEITADHFGVAVRMACADASAPYTLPLQDQHMFPDDLSLPVCLVQRYEHREEYGGRRGARQERVDASIGRGAATAQRSSDTAVGMDKEELIVARTSPPVSPVWVPAHQPAFGRASTLPTNSVSSPVRILPLRTSRIQSATSVSPVAAAGPRTLRHTRAASSSPRSGGGDASVGTLDSATAAAAVAAAVAAAIPTLTDEDRSRSPSPAKKVAARRARGRGRRRRSKSSSPPEAQTLAVAPGEAGFVEARGEGRGRKEKAGRSLSPLMSKGRGFFLSSSKSPRWRPSIRSPGRKRGARAEKKGGGDSVTQGGNTAGDGRSGDSDGDGDGDGNRRPDGEGVDAGSMGEESSGHGDDSSDGNRVNLCESEPQRASEDDAAASDTLIAGRGPEMPPPPPPPPPPSYSTPPTARRAVRASPHRKSPVASPVRPPLKPMAAEQHQHQKEGQPEDTASRSASGGAKSRSAVERSSLLDGVEQSSDLGAFFRQGEAGQGGSFRRRGRRSSPRRRGVSPRAGRSPRAGLGRSPRRGDVAADASEEGGGKDDNDEDNGAEEDDDEEEENGRGAGVGVHVIVLHHGYCGSSMDMRLIKNYIRILAPNALVLNAESNERDPHTSMKVMGEKLAKEVHRFLLVRARSLLLPGGQGRLSFIGHSAGAIIIRVALTSPSLVPALGRLHMFVSLGSPHLGTVYGASGIVRTGMWAMKRWTKSQLLEELGLTDASRPRDTLLCWLSKQPGLEYFRHVVLVSADKDGYVPPQSARIQTCDASIRDAKREVPHGQVVCEMARALLDPIDDDSLYRLHLWGRERQANSGGGGMDEYIGRAAHISMMDSPSLVCLLLCTLLDLIR